MAANWNSFLQTIESLPIDLQRLANNSEAAEKDLAVEALTSIPINRIVALEAACAIFQSLTSAPTQNAISLSVAALEALQEATESIPRQNPD